MGGVTKHRGYKQEETSGEEEQKHGWRPVWPAPSARPAPNACGQTGQGADS
eukprot:CAMPEP_0206269814 /NCGR_PEP_ID=MMETSP0047_2-20121206/32513_1 /ASSEMBLY_ACC=CAM_ASM_000192 /TAXON_ID=195065 /ORGANISM="Chroomonas mesostigmatica_cf, Strain CCMP1168" /LENGTH=50 /DNA_ID=CAMNT_0053698369 /DNA_START=166 /DNA_END=318 /DNA_ORIENTATION=-